MNQSPLIKNVIFFDCSDLENIRVFTQGKAVLPTIGTQFNLQGMLVEVCHVGFGNKTLDIYDIWVKPCKK